MHEKRKEISLASVQDQRRARTASELDVGVAVSQVEHIEAILSTIPADIISRRAVESQSYARALFYWERFMRQANYFETASVMTDSRRSHYQRLQDIYTQIDEPDSIEGHFFSFGILQYRTTDFGGQKSRKVGCCPILVRPSPEG